MSTPWMTEAVPSVLALLTALTLAVAAESLFGRWMAAVEQLEADAEAG